jgi:hypothetical protein
MKKVISIWIAMLLVMAAVAPAMAYTPPTMPAMACPCEETGNNCDSSYVAVGPEDIAKNKEAQEALRIVMASKELREISLNLTTQGYIVMINEPIVVVNTSSNVAAVIFDAVPIDNQEERKAALFVVDLESGEVIEAYGTNWCYVACRAAAMACGGGCLGVCCLAAPPLCPVCAWLCALACSGGFIACYDWCTSQ